MKKQPKPPPKAKPFRGWAVYSTTAMIPLSLAYSRRDSINKVCDVLVAIWQTLESRGYTCRRVIVTEDVEGSDDA